MILLPGQGKQHEAGRKDGAEQMTAYIWDLDGTLLDSYGVIVEGAARTSAEAGLQDTADEVLKSVKQGSVTEYLNGVSLRSGVPFAQLLAQYRLYAHGLDDRIILTDGAKETLERLRRGGAVHFVYTHRGSSSGPILERLGILDCFCEIVTSENGFRPRMIRCWNQSCWQGSAIILTLAR